MNGNRCDAPGCEAFSAPSARWLYLIQQPEEYSIMASLGIGRAEPLTFCSYRCVAQYAYVATVTTEAPAGVEPPQRQEPPPQSGIGWPW